MGTHITSTGNITEDIDTIIEQVNNLYNSDSINNALNISAIGQLQTDVPDQDGVGTTVTFTHNLGYPPVFLAFLQLNNGVSDFLYPLPFNVATYEYNSGAKTPGAYPYCLINPFVTNTQLNITVNNLSNPSHFVAISGPTTFTYYLFSRPVTS